MKAAIYAFNTFDKSIDKMLNETFVIDGADSVQVVYDVVYNAADEKSCRADYYFVPKNEGTYPVLINIHGGAFIAGDKKYRRALCTWHATHGLFVFNVNYGLCPEYSFPTPIEHLIAALNWIADNAENLRLDLSRVAVGGDSAGAYYAAMLGAISSNPKLQEVFENKPKVRLRALLLNCGLYDIDIALNRKLMFNLNKKIFKSFCGCEQSEFETYQYKDFCSPLPFVDKNFPAVFVVYAQRDVLCRSQGEPLTNRLDEHDVYYESYHTISSKRNHCFSLVWTTKEAKEANALLRKFLDRLIDGTLPISNSTANVLVRAQEKIKPKRKAPAQKVTKPRK
ncbi:MAG: alpha/beta hydrolase [Clostridia bacterium]|nr:alpha/beta hydrolase [Clostridia bacterium]